MNEKDEILTVNEVAARLKIHIKTVYSMINRGDLKGFKIGQGNWRFRKVDLDQLINGKGSE